MCVGGAIENREVEKETQEVGGGGGWEVSAGNGESVSRGMGVTEVKITFSPPSPSSSSSWKDG